MEPRETERPARDVVSTDEEDGDAGAGPMLVEIKTS